MPDANGIYWYGNCEGVTHGATPKHPWVWTFRVTARMNEADRAEHPGCTHYVDWFVSGAGVVCGRYFIVGRGKEISSTTQLYKAAQAMIPLLELSLCQNTAERRL